MTSSARRRTLLVLVAVLLAVSGCTGVPSSSAPRTVESIDITGDSEAALPGPTPGAPARTIVQEFLAANPVDPRNHAAARKYLSPTARRTWSDASATIVANTTVNRYEGGVVTVSGRFVGSLTPAGVFVPQPVGIGDGGPTQQFTYKVGRVDGEYRITGPASGLLLTVDQFKRYYQQHALYFFDSARRYLVPDTRWSALSGLPLANWLCGQLAAGPRSDLVAAVTVDTLPAQANARRITATDGNPLRIEVPGAAQLDVTARRQLAAQLAATVTDPASPQQILMTDGGSVVPLPGFRGGQFTSADLYAKYAPPTLPAEVFYVYRGNVVQDGTGPLPGKLRSSPYALTSVAVARAADGSLLVAGVTPFPGGAKGNTLVIGTAASGYKLTSVTNVTSRPTWAPATGAKSPREVWVGVGGQLTRVTVSGSRPTAAPVSLNTGAGGGRITAVRLSPEGARLAMVIDSQNGSRRLYIGTIARTAGQVRVDSAPTISPEGVTIGDAAWIGTQKLIAIGALRASGGISGDPRIFETNVDGSNWSGRSPGSGLPTAPDSVTAAISQFAWVSANDTVWEQFGRSWSSPGSTDQTLGTNPIYLE